MRDSEGGQTDDQKAIPQSILQNTATSISTNDQGASASLWRLSLILKEIAETHENSSEDHKNATC